MSNQAAYQYVTDRMIKALEQGTVPWNQPWTATDMPSNYVSHKAYNGSNLFLLQMARQASGFTSNVWMTRKQCQDLKGQYPSKPINEETIVVYFTFLDKKDDEGNVKGKIPFLKYSVVYNVEECKGVKIPESKPFAMNLACENIGNVVIKHGGDRAFYSKKEDYIQLPTRESFRQEAEYYSTRFHELVHATGAIQRLNRPSLIDAREFGDTNYSKEELVAEMGATILCSLTGIENTASFQNNAAYIQSWISALKNDKKMLVTAASQAQKAVDYLIENSR